MALLFLCGMLSHTQSQVTISPEIGLSYSPFEVESLGSLESGSNASNRVDPLVGISGTVPLNEQWNLNMRISYAPREDLKWISELPGIIPVKGRVKYEHDDFNIDLSGYYDLSNIVQMGAGISYVRTINGWTSYQTYYPPDLSEQNYEGSKQLSESKYGAFAGCSIMLRYITFKLEYSCFFFDSIENSSLGGKNRYQFTLSVPLFGGSKGKK